MKEVKTTGYNGYLEFKKKINNEVINGYIALYKRSFNSGREEVEKLFYNNFLDIIDKVNEIGYFMNDIEKIGDNQKALDYINKKGDKEFIKNKKIILENKSIDIKNYLLFRGVLLLYSENELFVIDNIFLNDFYKENNIEKLLLSDILLSLQYVNKNNKLRLFLGGCLFSFFSNKESFLKTFSKIFDEIYGEIIKEENLLLIEDFQKQIGKELSDKSFFDMKNLINSNIGTFYSNSAELDNILNKKESDGINFFYILNQYIEGKVSIETFFFIVNSHININNIKITDFFGYFLNIGFSPEIDNKLYNLLMFFLFEIVSFSYKVIDEKIADYTKLMIGFFIFQFDEINNRILEELNGWDRETLLKNLKVESDKVIYNKMLAINSILYKNIDDIEQLLTIKEKKIYEKHVKNQIKNGYLIILKEKEEKRKIKAFTIKDKRNLYLFYKVYEKFVLGLNYSIESNYIEAWNNTLD